METSTTALTAKHETPWTGDGPQRNAIEAYPCATPFLKRGFIGTWHELSAKPLPPYVIEMTFRFNRRNDLDLFIDTLRHMVSAPTLPYSALTK
jgi:hypothetical protein